MASRRLPDDSSFFRHVHTTMMSHIFKVQMDHVVRPDLQDHNHRICGRRKTLPQKKV